MAEAFRLGIAGLGTVGAGVIKVVQKNASLLAARGGKPIAITAISSRNRGKDRGVDLSAYEWVDDPQALASRNDVDAVIELIGGSDGPAYALVKKSLENGKHVITANKALLAHHGFELASLAESKGVVLAYEAAVAGGVPAIKALREGLTANRITAVYGILNGTCNYILTQMRETGRGFDAVLKEAQEKGYAEADPAFDVDGVDAGHKISLLASIAFGMRTDFKSVALTGIRHLTATDIAFAGELGYKIKLLGIAKYVDGSVIQSVEPCLVPASSPLGAIEDVYNAVFVEGDFVETPLFTGRGAGEGPTASAVVADIVDLVRGQRIPTFGVSAAQLKTLKSLDPGESISRYYLRLTVLDQAGVLADVSAILRDHKISVEGLIQRGRNPGQPVPLVMTVYETKQADIVRASKALEKLGCVVEKPCTMRIEEQL